EPDCSQRLFTIAGSGGFGLIVARLLLQLYYACWNSGDDFSVANNVHLGCRATSIPLDRVIARRKLLARHLHGAAEVQVALMAVVGCKCACWKQRQNQNHDRGTQGLHTNTLFFPDASGTVWWRPLFDTWAGAWLERAFATCKLMQIAYNAPGLITGIALAWG